MGGDHEYEYFYRIAAQHLPQLIQLLDGRPGDDLHDVPLNWTGERSFEFERRLHTATFPVNFFSC